jgi:antitoxin component YwqK of YwqJK toxin-antitoxin module
MGFLSDFLFGKKDGPFESYYRSGQLKERVTYKDGEFEGLCEEYYKNGQLEWKGTYNMGEECGEWFEDGETVTYDPCPPDLEGEEQN